VAGDLLDPERLRASLGAADVDAVEIIRAPGRVNLIGEHTDYNDGFVMPAAIGLEIRLAVVPVEERRVSMTLDATGETAAFDLDAIGGPTRSWIDYVAGTAWALSKAGHEVRGFRAILASELPQGAGLSSSAALEMASALALLGRDRPLSVAERARIGRRAENAYVGVQSGVMDQFASAGGVADHAILLDCRSLEVRPVRLPLPEVRLVVCHSGSPHKLEASQYNQRKAEAERAVATIATIDPTVRALRDVDDALLARARPNLDDVAYRRAKHVVDENARVLQTEAALEAGELEAVGRLFAASHASLRDLYEVSSPELDALVDIATSVPGVVGVRMTGGGFGGSTVNLVRRDAIPALRAAVERDYRRRTGLTAAVFDVDAVAGAGWVTPG
jgi:galactokinase